MNVVVHNVPLDVTNIGLIAMQPYINQLDADRGPNGSATELSAFMRATGGMKVLVDVGAEMGLFSLLFTAKPGSVAYAFEPGPLAFQYLTHHCRTNPTHKVIPLKQFVGDRGGKTVTCGIDRWHIVANGGKQFVGGFSFQEVAIDDMPEMGRVDCIKIDVEAYEVQVLRGAKRTITEHRPVIFLEGHLNNLCDNGSSRGELWTTIKELGYSVRTLAGEPIDSFDGGSLVRVVCSPE